MPKTERRLRLTATRKLELYLASRSPEAPIGEILRQRQVGVAYMGFTWTTCARSNGWWKVPPWPG